MKAALQKIAPYLLLCISVLPVIFAFYTQTAEVIIHRRVAEELRQKSLVTIHASASQLVWTETGKEVLINGKLFDVAKFTVDGEEIQLTGLFDKDEDDLIARVNDQQKNNPDACGGITVLKWLSCFSWIHDREPNEFCFYQKLSTPISFQNDHIETPVLSCETPPPEAALFSSSKLL